MDTGIASSEEVRKTATSSAWQSCRMLSRTVLGPLPFQGCCGRRVIGVPPLSLPPPKSLRFVGIII